MTVLPEQTLMKGEIRLLFLKLPCMFSLNAMPIVDAQAAKKAWERLEKESSDKGLFRRISLNHCLLRMMYEDFSSMVSYIEAVPSVAQQLNEIGHPTAMWTATLI
jgi:hypothetical protein